MAVVGKNSGLDTLSREELIEKVHRWTGELAAADTTSYDEVISHRVMGQTIEQWHTMQAEARQITPEQMFGSQSELLAQGVASDSVDVAVADSVVAAEGVSDMTSAVDALSAAEIALGWAEWLFNIGVVVAIGVYLYSMYRYYEDVVVMFSSVLRGGVVVSSRVSERRQSDIFNGFLGKLIFVGVAFVGLLTFGFVLRGGMASAVDTTLKALMLPIAIVMIFVAMVCVQHLFLWCVGYVTRSRSMVRALIQMRTIYFVFLSVAVAPLLLLSQMQWGGVYAGWLIVAAVVALVALGLYLKESLEMFMSKKVSILHWFLYLCTVEVLPLSFLWQLIYGKLGSNF